jgi:DNA (cytosine-5)-methyltransferase 1
MTLTFGSLFAGVGGFDMGFEQAGWDCKFQVEWDKNCQQILNKHWPDVPKWLDVSDVNGAEIPPVDCIIFGSPCQDLSVAGKRAGLEGERSGLFHEAVRIIKEMRDATNGTFPRWTVWENVAGALSSNNGRDFGTVINEMAKAGACLQEYAVLDAQHFGIPQRRGACSSSLALILQPPTDVQTRYYLSPKACEGILRRANKRGKVLPERLQKAWRRWCNR